MKINKEELAAIILAVGKLKNTAFQSDRVKLTIQGDITGLVLEERNYPIEAEFRPSILWDLEFKLNEAYRNADTDAIDVFLQEDTI